MQNAKVKKIREILQGMESVLVAYSGGVDSSLLLYLVSLECPNSLAVIANSFLYPKRELEEAKTMAENFGIDYIFIETDELKNPKFIENPPNRCYFCKNGLFLRLENIAKEKGISHIIDGTNLDDEKDFRPGMKAKEEFRIRSPLKEAGFTKNEIRALSKKLNLSTWNKPSFACLASRFPYGEKITKEKLKTVERGEEFLKDLGFKQLRVRSHNGIARIEVEKREMKKALELKDEIAKALKGFGFSYITLDLAGYRTGSMNEAIL
ncbi:MAG: ATP-dependent sacrificial sulfur transferase LarE [bacterium]